ncbi:MAG: HK97 family phage prohead protease [Candidatus Saccharibacteria bacterium]|nr:HK97 family phage prohead protease [Candidatus Saccharibacteria bacterium]
MDKKDYVIQIKSHNDEAMTLTAIISDGQPDLDGEVVSQAGIKYDKYLRKGGLFLRNHDAKSLPLGRVKSIFLDPNNQTIAEIQFSQHNPDGKMYYQMVKDKEINSFSIGFKTLDSEMIDGIKHLTEIELFEISLVNIGANESASVKTPTKEPVPTCICCKSPMDYVACSEECSEKFQAVFKQKLTDEMAQYI